MMAARRVRCPECTVILDIPEGFQGTKVRCSVCQAEFRIPGVSDEEILDWIVHEEKEDTTHGAAPSLPKEGEPAAQTMVASAVQTSAPPPGNIPEETPPEEPEEEPFHGHPAGAEGFVLLRIDTHGALFEFPATMLESVEFRSAIPRKCLRCGTENFIHPRVVIYGPMLKDCTTLEAKFLDRSTKLSEQEVRHMSTEEVLERLPGPEHLPSPADLTMVYWICDMCNPSKLIYAQNRIDVDEHEGRCCLQISRLWRAEEFLVAAGGENTEAHDEIRSSIEKHPEEPWDRLPGAVQQRLRQWYAPHRGEQFIAYCPDRSHTRTEDGMAGILISTRRLMYHTSLRNYESIKGEPLDLSFSMDNGRQMLKIEAPNWEIKNMIVDKAGLRTLRLALAEQNYTAQWQ